MRTRERKGDHQLPPKAIRNLFRNARGEQTIEDHQMRREISVVRSRATHDVIGHVGNPPVAEHSLFALWKQPLKRHEDAKEESEADKDLKAYGR